MGQGDWICDTAASIFIELKSKGDINQGNTEIKVLINKIENENHN